MCGDGRSPHPAHPTPRGGTDPGAFLEAVCAVTRSGLGGDPFHWVSREALFSC